MCMTQPIAECLALSSASPWAVSFLVRDSTNSATRSAVLAGCWLATPAVRPTFSTAGFTLEAALTTVAVRVCRAVVVSSE